MLWNFSRCQILLLVTYAKRHYVLEFGFPNTVMIVDADGNILNSEGQNKMLTTQSELTRAGASIQNIRGSESKQSTCSAELPGGNLILETLSREELLKRYVFHFFKWLTRGGHKKCLDYISFAGLVYFWTRFFVYCFVQSQDIGS